MSPAEYFELINMASGSAGIHGMNAMSILFAYVIAAYFVGAKLSRFQLVSINILYSVFITIQVLAYLAAINVGSELISQFALEHPEVLSHYSLNSGRDLSGLFFIVNSLIWVGARVLSLAFMFNTRKQNIVEFPAQ